MLQPKKILISLFSGLLLGCLSPSFADNEESQHQENTAIMPHFSKAEIHIIQSLSSDNLPMLPDDSNRVAANSNAIQFGKQLFFDPRLSGDGNFSCASCHNPKTGWSKHEATTQLRATYPAKRHTPSLWGVAYNRWFFWDGRVDSLWSQALKPIENPAELANHRIKIAQLIINNLELCKTYQSIFGTIPTILLSANFTKLSINSDNAEALWNKQSTSIKNAINTLFANIGKAIASFEATIVANNTAFDQFAKQLLEKQPLKNYAISAMAARGLKLFIGKATCVQCHSGANFSDGEFHNSFLTPISKTGDLGRYSAIELLKKDAFNANSIFSDADKNTCLNKLDYIYKNVAFRGQFKTPSLRNIALSYPYMHTGEFKTLNAVISYYNTISERIDASKHQEVLLKSLSLSQCEQDELVAFLYTLNNKENTENN